MELWFPARKDSSLRSRPSLLDNHRRRLQRQLDPLLDKMTLPLIVTLSGPVLQARERAFLQECSPLGVILFERNLQTRDSIRRFTESIREALGRDGPILIDQEGGKYSRLGLRSSHHPMSPLRLGKIGEHALAKAVEMARLDGMLVAQDLRELGITVNCSPVLDVPTPFSPSIISQRTFSHDPPVVAALGGAVASGLLDGGVIPIMKHIPGHGRTTEDSHAVLPIVSTSLAELEQTDFRPFAENVDVSPWARVAHVVYQAVDKERPASQSAAVISDVIRCRIGFEGVLITDDVGMGALNGTVRERITASLDAGNDIVLTCDTSIPELLRIAHHIPSLTSQSQARLQRAAPSSVRAPDPAQMKDVPGRLARLIAEFGV